MTADGGTEDVTANEDVTQAADGAVDGGSAWSAFKGAAAGILFPEAATAFDLGAKYAPDATGDAVGTAKTGLDLAGIAASTTGNPLWEVDAGLAESLAGDPNKAGALVNKAGDDVGSVAKKALTLIGVLTSPWFYVPVGVLLTLGILSPYLSPVLKRI